MPLWLNIAIGIYLGLWTLMAVCSLYDDVQKVERYRVLHGRTPNIEYNALGKFMILMWVPADVLFLCYNLFA
ncbi:hypothetical protein [Burkholderia phage vB_BpP_HN03]